MKIVCEEKAERLDIYLRDETEFTRSKIKSLIDGGNVLVNGGTVKAGAKIKSGDVIQIQLPKEPVFEAEDIPLDVVYEDDSLAVINKQRHLVVHPGAGHTTGTLVNALMYRMKSLSCGGMRAGIVHRLDKDTTGLMIIAKTDYAHAKIAEEIAERRVVKKYRAILDGNPKSDSGTIITKIDRDPKNRLKMAVSGSGREAITEYEVKERFDKSSYVEFNLKTGRTHQIRVHAAYIHCPVACDVVYGRNQPTFSVDGQLLHSRYIEFTHPVSGERINFTAEEPEDFMQVLTKLRRINVCE